MIEGSPDISITNRSTQLCCPTLALETMSRDRAVSPGTLVANPVVSHACVLAPPVAEPAGAVPPSVPEAPGPAVCEFAP